MRLVVYVLVLFAAATWTAPAFAASASGDFNGDGFADLAVGLPWEDIGIIENAGAVNVIYGRSAGLSDTGGQIWHQDSTDIEDTAEVNDHFGASLATGDFDGDGFADLAVGIPQEDVGAIPNAGAVSIIYGSASGLSSVRDQLWHQDSPNVADAAEGGDHFGHALAAANLGKSRHADLAVGVPSEDVATNDEGAVSIIYGSASGLSAVGDQLWHQNRPGIEEAGEAFDDFGVSLAAANFGRSSHADLAIGVPGEDVGASYGGAVSVLYGSPSGLSAVGDQLWHQNRSGIADTAESGDYFGTSLAAANFGRSSHADLAVGVSSEDLGAVSSAGAINVLYGTASGLSARGNQFWHQNRPGIIDTGDTDDFFGYALAGANLGKTSHADLAVGVPFEELDGTANTGAVAVLYGTPTGLAATGDQLWHQDLTGVEDVGEANDDFGWSLASANLGSTSHSDLAVGVPREGLGPIGTAGAVNVFYGSSSGLAAFGNEFWHQDSAGVPDTAEIGDRFGEALGPRR